MPVYLHLFHGRKDPGQQMDNWGEDGPVLGPFEWVQVTYGFHIKTYDMDLKQDELFIGGALIEYEGMYYGDFTITSEPPED